jgi:hypothetical protein
MSAAGQVRTAVVENLKELHLPAMRACCRVGSMGRPQNWSLNSRMSSRIRALCRSMIWWDSLNSDGASTRHPVDANQCESGIDKSLIADWIHFPV